MPELPEVEDAARRLRVAIVGQRIAAVTVRHAALARSLTPAACGQMVGLTVTAVERRAKIQLVHFDDGHLLEVHFRMTGDWAMSQVHAGDPVFERVCFRFEDGTRVSFVDSRALGVMTLHAPGGFIAPALGPEPLEDAFDVAALRVALASRRGPIKPVLLDQKVVAGLGNIYAAEALWEARIHPATRANSLSAPRLTRLRDAIRLVLTRAPAGRYYGSTADEPTAASADGWCVYGREGEPCVRCGTRLARMVQAGRSTFFCRRCQR